MMDPEWRRLRVACARGYVEHVSDLMRECAALSDRERRIRERMGLKGVAYDGVTGGGVATGDAIPAALAELDEVMGERAATIRAAADEVRWCQLAISEVSDPMQRAVLDLKYLQGMTWPEVGEYLHVSERWCREIRDDGLCELFDHMPHVWRIARPPAV